MILIDLIHPCFQDVNGLFLLSFKDNANRTIYKQYFLPTIEIKDYNVMINGQNFFDQPIKNAFKTYDNIPGIANGQGDDYTTVSPLDYPYLKE